MERKIMSKRGVLVVGHGSKLEYSKKAVCFFAEKLRERVGLPVEVGFMNINEPGINESLMKLVNSGVETVYVLPAFLAHGIHTTRDITRKIGLTEGSKEGLVSVNGTTVLLKYCDPIGPDERVVDILEERLKQKIGNT